MRDNLNFIGLSKKVISVEPKVSRESAVIPTRFKDSYLAIIHRGCRALMWIKLISIPVSIKNSVLSLSLGAFNIIRGAGSLSDGSEPRPPPLRSVLRDDLVLMARSSSHP